MKYPRHAAWIVAFIVAVGIGCGAAQQHRKRRSHSGGHDGRSRHSGKGHEHAAGDPDRDFPPSMARFHEEMDAVWHAPADADRVALSCEAVPSLSTSAHEIVDDETPDKVGPEHDGDWRTATAGLLEAVADLASACAKQPRSGVATGLENVHEAFHRIVVVWDEAH